MTFSFAPTIADPRRIAQMAENMTVAQIAARLGLPEADVEDHLDAAGRKGQGNWLLTCHKTGRYWRCHSERACYRKAMMVGLVDYDFENKGAPPVSPQMLSGDIDARIAELMGRGWSQARIGQEVGISAPAVNKRLQKMRGRA